MEKPLDPNIELRIDQLILHDVPSHQRHQIAAAIEQELARLLTASGVSLGIEASGQATLLHHAVDVAPGLTPDALAAQVGQSLYAGLVAHE